MFEKYSQDIVLRWERNPIITSADLPFPCNDIHNAGAVKVGDEYILLLTIETLEGLYSIYPARSMDGYHFNVSDQPLMTPSTKGLSAIYEKLGILDARVVLLDDVYYISYVTFGPLGYCLGLASTKDFQIVQRIGIISEPDTKASALFPKKIKGKYTRLERPWQGNSIWVSYSDDLEYWGWSEVVMTPRGGFWDNDRIGVATPPLEIEEGWLFIYYGVKQTSSGPLFRLGAAILGKEDPTQIIGRTNIPVLSPRELYERIGDISNLVFSCGAIIEPNNEVKLYYGAAHSCICVGTTKLKNIVQICIESDKEF